VEAEDTVLYNSSKWQVVEEGSEVLPHVSVAVLTEALIVEAVNLCDLLALVISTQNGDTIWEAYFQANKQSHSLD
jgi:hypothetical protein